ncbi:hypothetical protein [Rodentibacter rarus]|nr:hypothetical protein [Rodentibacter rarus]
MAKRLYFVLGSTKNLFDADKNKMPSPYKNTVISSDFLIHLAQFFRAQNRANFQSI